MTSSSRAQTIASSWIFARYFVCAPFVIPGWRNWSSLEMMRKIEQPQLFEVLDRILDKGIVIDAWILFSLAGMDFLTVEARIVVASIETYLEHAQALRNTQPQSSPPKVVEITSSKIPHRIKSG